MRIRQILRIARIELSKNRSLAKKEFLLTIIPTLFVFGIIFLTLMTKGFFVGDNFYRINTNDEQLKALFVDHPKFMIDPRDPDVMFLKTAEEYRVISSRTDRSRGALFSALEIIKEHNLQLYSQLTSELTHPVLVQTTYEERNVSIGFATKTSVNATTLAEREQNEEQSEASSSENEVQNSQTQVSQTSAAASSPSSEAQDNPETTSIESKLVSPEAPTTSEMLETTTEAVPPSQLNSLATFSSMYLAMLLVFPFTIISLLYTNSLMHDKTNRRIHLLLASPVSNWEIIIGKTLPYAMIALFSAIALSLRVEFNMLLCLKVLLVALVVSLVYWAISFVVATISRDAKELSFLLIFFLSMYSFLLLIPTFLTTISDLSLISPLTLVARLFSGQALEPTTYLFTLLPHFLGAIVLFLLGASMYNEENLLSYRTIKQKFLSGLAKLLKEPRHLFFYSMSIVPFAFIFEMILLVGVVTTTKHFLILVLLLAAGVEEALKCLGLWTVAQQREMKFKETLLWGFVAGFGFFLVEKGSLLLTLPDLVQSYTYLIMGGLLVPLLLHVGLAILFLNLLRVFGKNYGFTSYLCVTLVHFLVNFNLVRWIL